MIAWLRSIWRPSAVRQSILLRSIAAVLLVELLAAFLLIAVTAAHERHARLRAFDATLQGRANALMGSVQDADDAADNVMLDKTGLDTPKDDLYEVAEGGRILGQSPNWPSPSTSSTPQLEDRLRHGASRVIALKHRYRFTTLHGVRLVDPGEAGGGKLHHIVVFYGASTEHMQGEVLEAVRFYAIVFALAMLLTASLLAWFLRRALSPLHELAAAAGKISVQAWHFAAPRSAWTTRELAPLTTAIEASVQRLQQSFQQQRRFTSDAAHELKTDVAIIKSSLQLLTMRHRSASEYEQGLALSLGDCDRLEQAVQEMLTLARVEHADTLPSQTRQTETANLAWHAAGAVRYLAPMAKLHGIHLDDASTTAPRSNASCVALSAKDCDLLCINLLQNAIQHSKPSNATTGEHARGTPTVVIQVIAAAGYVQLTIQNQGEAILPEALPHIFEPFYRADKARDRQHGGTGLGLAICKAICEKAGGSIAITSEPESGTLVAVRLPRHATT